MLALYKSGRYLFAIAIIAFGTIQLITGDFMSGFLHVKVTFPARIFFLYFISTLFVFSGLAMLFDKTILGGARIVFLLFAVLFFYPHLFTLLSDIHNGGEWTVLGETLAMIGGSLILIGLFTSYPIHKDRILDFLKNKISTGLCLFASSLIIFAVLHFIYADYIATLIPAWIPLKLFFAYLVGIAFLLSALSIFLGIKTRLSCNLLGLMFLFWFIFLHLPRVLANPHKEPEWTSLFVALAFAGIFFIIADLPAKKSVV
jgi:uncharacterized membrane protein